MIDFKNLDATVLSYFGIYFKTTTEEKLFSEYVLEELEVKIGMQISEGISEDLLKEFDKVTSQAESINWLEKNRPDYHEIVRQERTNMAWNLLKYRKEVSSLKCRKEPDGIYNSIRVLKLSQLIYNCLLNAKLQYICDVIAYDNLRNIDDIDLSCENEIKTKIINYLLHRANISEAGNSK